MRIKNNSSFKIVSLFLSQDLQKGIKIPQTVLTADRTEVL